MDFSSWGRYICQDLMPDPNSFPPVFATVKAVLFDLLLALWRHGNPMLKSRLPMQITVLNDLAHLQEPGATRRCWFHFLELIHALH